MSPGLLAMKAVCGLRDVAGPLPESGSYSRLTVSRGSGGTQNCARLASNVGHGVGGR